MARPLALAHAATAVAFVAVISDLKPQSHSKPGWTPGREIMAIRRKASPLPISRYSAVSSPIFRRTRYGAGNAARPHSPEVPAAALLYEVRVTDSIADAILQVIPSLDAGGAERTAVDIAVALARKGVHALVLAEGGRLVPDLEASGAHFRPFPAATKNPVRMLTNVLRLAALARREGAALIHARSRAPAWTSLLAARRLKVPFVTTYHGVYRQSGQAKAFYNSVMARGDAVIANSRYTEKIILERHPFAAGRTEVIYRGTDLSQFDPDSIVPERIAFFRRAWGAEPGMRVVLLAARLTPWKGQRELIEAAALLGRQDVLFVLAGDAQGRGDYLKALRTRITALGAPVRIVGHVTDVPGAIAASDVIVAPSTEPEAFGRSAVEGLAMGRPVVASDLGAVRETILAPPDVDESRRIGWRVPPADPVALASALTSALDLSEEARAALAPRARSHAALFTLESMTDATLGLYQRLLDRPLRARKP